MFLSSRPTCIATIMFELSSITAKDANMIVCSIAGSRLDSAMQTQCRTHAERSNSLLCLLENYTVVQTRCCCTAAIHWFPIHHRINFKMAKFLFLARSYATSSYLNSSVAQYLPRRSLRSQDACLLAVPRCDTVRFTCFSHHRANRF